MKDEEMIIFNLLVCAADRKGMIQACIGLLVCAADRNGMIQACIGSGLSAKTFVR